MALTLSTLRKPLNKQVVDPSTGVMREEWELYFNQLTVHLNGAVGELGTDPAPNDAQYLVGAASSSLSAERVATNSTSNAFNLSTPGQVAVERAALTGDVTASANSNATTIANGAVSNAKLADMAAARVKGRAAGAGTGAPQDLTFLQVAAIGRRFENINSGYTVQDSDRGTILVFTGSSGTVSFPAAATLGADWYCYMRCDATVGVVLDPDGSEQIDDLTTWTLYPEGLILVRCGGTNFRTDLITPMRKVFTASDTFVTPGCGSFADVEAISDGAGGGRGGAGDGGAGGGGGSCVPRRLPLSALAATVAVTIGTGGAGATADNTAGSAGTGASFGTHVVAYPGGGGDGINATPGGGGGGGTTSAGASVSNSATGGAGGDILGGAGGSGGSTPGGDSTFGGGGGGPGLNASGGIRAGNSVYGGGGGAGGNGNATPTAGGVGGSSVYGGGGGGGGSDAGTPGAGGTSLYAGNGGAGATGAANATNGSAPGGGGGGSETGNAGNGARGEIRVVIC